MQENISKTTIIIKTKDGYNKSHKSKEENIPCPCMQGGYSQERMLSVAAVAGWSTESTASSAPS